jgi:hypothetical protein
MTKEMIMEVKEKPTGLYGVNKIMEGVMDAQLKHVERMKEAEKNQKPTVLLDEFEKDKKFDSSNLTDEQKKQLGHASYKEQVPSFTRDRYKEPEQPNSFKQFAEGMKKVECVECKSKVSLAECNYDPARNRYTCHKCDKKLKEAERARKEAETREQIKNLEGGIK